MRKTLSGIAALAALVLATAGQAQVLSAEPAQACPPSDAATPGTACGACGTGRRVGTGQQLFTEATRGIYVAADGYWTACTMPEDMPPPPPPKNCAVSGTPPVVVWQVGDFRCTGGHAVGVAHGNDHLYRQVFGAMRGELAQQCTDGELSTRWATCSPAQACNTGWSYTQGGTTYRYNGRAEPVPLGAYVQAKAADGQTLRLQCVGGDLVAKLQCVGPQTKGVRWSTQTRVYRYDGEPVEPGALVRMEQTHVVARDGTVSPGVNRIRWTMGQCMPNGQIQ